VNRHELFTIGILLRSRPSPDARTFVHSHAPFPVAGSVLSQRLLLNCTKQVTSGECGHELSYLLFMTDCS
jgi:hypothetical protein